MHPKELALIDRFEGFDSEHAPLNNPSEGGRDLVQDALWVFLRRAIDQTVEYGAHTNMTVAQSIRERIRRQAPDILETLELVAQWQANPIEAARQDLREMIELKHRLEAEERQAKEGDLLQSEIKKRADEFIENLRIERAALEAPSVQGANQ